MIVYLYVKALKYVCVCVGHRFKVPVESGLDEEKALEILALYVNGNSQNLPEQARSIVKECKGTCTWKEQVYTHAALSCPNPYMGSALSFICLILGSWHSKNLHLVSLEPF